MLSRGATGEGVGLLGVQALQAAFLFFEGTEWLGGQEGIGVLRSHFCLRLLCELFVRKQVETAQSLDLNSNLFAIDDFLSLAALPSSCSPYAIPVHQSQFLNSDLISILPYAVLLK